MIPSDLVELLRCPNSGQSLALAETEVLARLNERISGAHPPVEIVRNVAGIAVAQPIVAALLRRDRALLYPIRDGIPVLLAEEAISL